MDYRILVKRGVVFKEINPYTLLFFQALNHCCKKFQRSYTITSANDGVHSEKSYHYKDLSWDIRANDCPKAHRLEVVLELESVLPEYFDIVLEEYELDPAKDHFHIECDLKKLANYILENGNAEIHKIS